VSSVTGAYEPVLAQDLQGDALEGLGLVRGVGEDGQVRVGVHVDEPRGDRESLHVHDGARGARAAGWDDVGDAAVAEDEVGAAGGTAGAVDHQSAGEYGLGMHCSSVRRTGHPGAARGRPVSGVAKIRCPEENW